ncbi:MAG: 4-(cytidine 5'-diphospho)-2-C-methyl-D-erythritol kinase [Acidimicrobiales bacterium]
MPAEDRDVGRLIAPAKLTVRLRVTGVRPDGYHLLDSEMVSVDLCDELELSPGEGLVVVDQVGWMGGLAEPVGLSGPVELAEPAEPAGPPPPRAAGRNLVEVALAAVGRRVAVRLTKRIPAAAGLGGGSADAAAILRWAGCRDAASAAAVGADVPFCLVGGRASVRGVGEVVEPLDYLQASYLLVVPRLPVSTPAVYRAWDALGGPPGDRGNDLEPAALLVEPRLGWWRDLVERVTGERPSLAGSGGTWWTAGSRPRLDELAAQMEAAVADSRESALVRVVDAVAGSGAVLS